MSTIARKIMACRKTTILGLFLLITACQMHAQLGGSSTYSFLNLTNSARVASLGGKTISSWDDDLNLPFNNPSLLNDSMDGHLVVNYVNYFSDINYGYVSYARHIEKLGNFAAGLHYINYGQFIAADPVGAITGNFTASEYALNLIWSRPIDSLFHVGVNVKPVYSVLESYQSFGLLADAGITFVNRKKLFTASLVFRNFGSQLKAYHDHNREPVPFEIIIGISQKLEHAPFRFFVLAQNLQRLDLTWDETGDQNNQLDPLSGDPLPENNVEVIADKVMRHMIFGLEFVPIDHFYLRAGYNYQRRQEMKISSNVAMVGFSWGFGLRISKFHLSYGRATYHLAGASNHFSISTDLSTFLPSL
jgi:hypothetical protein